MFYVLNRTTVWPRRHCYQIHVITELVHAFDIDDDHERGKFRNRFMIINNALSAMSQTFYNFLFFAKTNLRQRNSEFRWDSTKKGKEEAIFINDWHKKDSISRYRYYLRRMNESFFFVLRISINWK